MRPAERYLFDRWFDAVLPDALPVSGSTSEHSGSVEPAYTSEDIQRARADGIALGRAEAISEYEIERESEWRRHDTLAAVAERLAELLAKSAQVAEEAGRDALVIAGAVARKLLPRLYRERACSEIEGFVESVLARVQDEPAVTVHISPTLVDALAPTIEAAVAASGHEKRLRVMGDPAVAEGDCRIEWSGGGIIRDQTALWREIDTLMAESVGSVAPPPASPPHPRLATGVEHV
jgi:flagellar assembly protein FliH